MDLKVSQTEMNQAYETSQSYGEWKRKWEQEAKELPAQYTLSGIQLDAVYAPEHIKSLDYNQNLSYPGEFPFTRGVYRTMYRGKLWTIRLFAGYGCPEDTNARFKLLLSRGQTGLSTAFDMPTLMGYDPDDEMAQGEVGREGVSVCHTNDMLKLFDGIDIGKVTVSMTINAPSPIVFAFYLAAAEKRGIAWTKLGGTTQTDILKEYMAQKEWIVPPEPAMRMVVDKISFSVNHVPKWHPISISGYHIREAGSTAVQELAFTLANGFACVEACLEHGLDIDEFAPRLSFFFNCHMDFFEEIAKFRAARRIWAKAMRYKYGAKDPRSWTLRFHTQTAGCSLLAQQPQVNLIRTTVEALAAVLGGTQSLHTNSLDEALGLPTEEAAKLALRTQQVIAHETGVASVIDPLGGSYFVEWLTDRMEESAEEYFRKIESVGGVIEGIKAGFFQREIARSAYEYEQAVKEKRRFVVGVNCYEEPEELKLEIFKLSPEVEEKRKLEVKEYRRHRDQSQAKQALKAVEQAAKNDKPLMPYFVDAARAGCTLGEIVKVLKSVFGEYREPPIYW